MNLGESTAIIDARQLYNKGCKLQHVGKLSEAVTILNKAINRNARYAQAYFIRGACHYMLGHYQLARNDLDAASLLGCEDAQLWSKFDSRTYENEKEDC